MAPAPPTDTSLAAPASASAAAAALPEHTLQRIFLRACQRRAAGSSDDAPPPRAPPPELALPDFVNALVRLSTGSAAIQALRRRGGGRDVDAQVESFLETYCLPTAKMERGDFDATLMRRRGVQALLHSHRPLLSEILRRFGRDRMAATAATNPRTSASEMSLTSDRKVELIKAGQRHEDWRLGHEQLLELLRHYDALNDRVNETTVRSLLARSSTVTGTAPGSKECHPELNEADWQRFVVRASYEGCGMVPEGGRGRTDMAR